MTKRKAIVSVFDDIMISVMTCIKNAGYKVTLVEEFEDAVELLEFRNYDLLVYEVSPPHGIQIIKKIRQICYGAIISIIKSTDFADCEPYLAIVDDVILHDFAPEELIARARTVSQHPRTSWLNRDIYGLPLVFGDLHIYTVSKQVLFMKKPIPLTRTEFNILLCLAVNAGAVLSRYEIYVSVWSDTDYYNFDVEKNINNHISNIRKKLKIYTSNDYIRAKNGEGYVFIPIIQN